MPDLDRFLVAQARSYDDALAELRAGRKVSHWMWYVFPQLRSLGRSSTAQFYGIAELAEARAYLAHPVLGPRLLAAAEAALLHQGKAAGAILGEVDALKLRSSATLFRAAAEPGTELWRAMGELLGVFYGGQECPLTRAALDSMAPEAGQRDPGGGAE